MSDTANDVFRAISPESYVILGLKLKPFSLGHYFTLRRQDCGFVADDSRPVTREDLIFACLVCSMDYGDFQKWLEQPPMSWPQRLKVAFSWCPWIEKLLAFRGLSVQYQLSRWGRRVGLFDLNEKAKLFQSYLDECSKSPKVWFEREAKKPTGGHWAQSVLLALTGECGFTFDQAMNMPLRLALLHFFKHAESVGAVTLMTDEEIEVAHGS